MEQWRLYSEKFLNITPREQYLILFTGVAAILFIFFNFFISANIDDNVNNTKRSSQISRNIATQIDIVDTYEQALKKDPNTKIRKQIAQYESKLSEIDNQLLTLTSKLINPVQMRYALMDLLKLQKGVSLQGFQLIGAQALLTDKNAEGVESSVEDVASSEDLTLYRHGIRLSLTGSYFQLRDYLEQLESLSWKFFWQDFRYEVKEYPTGQLDIEIYSLSTKREFIGV